jgi:hypothetical protein
MIVYDGLSDWERPSASADAELIAEMRNALPKLLAVVDAAKEFNLAIIDGADGLYVGHEEVLTLIAALRELER